MTLHTYAVAELCHEAAHSGSGQGVHGDHAGEYLDLRRLVFNAGCRALIVPTLRTTYVGADNDPVTDT